MLIGLIQGAAYLPLFRHAMPTEKWDRSASGPYHGTTADAKKAPDNAELALVAKQS